MRRTAVTLSFAAVLWIFSGLSSGLAGDFAGELEKLLPPSRDAGQPPRDESPRDESVPGEATARTGETADRVTAALPGGNLYPEVRVRVTAPKHTILPSQASGRVDTVTVRDGDRFLKDQLLIEIDPTFENLQLKIAEANLSRRRLLLQMTEQMVALETKGVLELELARTDVMQAEAELEMIRARLERMRINAPFDGRVGDVGVRELQFVSEGQAIIEVIDDADMELEFIVSSLWLPWFKPGYSFDVRIDETGRDYRATLERIGGKVDPLSKSVKAYARLETSDPELMEGMSGGAVIPLPKDAKP